jgi:hypothetical protein
MLIKQGTLPAFTFPFPTGSIPNRYWVIKANDFNPIPVVPAGVGVMTNVYHATGAEGTWKIQLAGSETDTLGDLGIVVDDSVAQSRWVRDLQVVRDLPGETVTEVTGNITGNLLGHVNAADIVDVANTVFDLVDTIESGLNLRDCLRSVFAVLAGVSVLIPGGIGFQNFGQTKFRVTVNLAGDGSRPIVTYDFS